MALIESLAGNIQAFIGFLEAFVGGLFGLYLILLFLRFKEYRAMKKILAEVRDELKEISKKITKKK